MNYRQLALQLVSLGRAVHVDSIEPTVKTRVEAPTIDFGLSFTTPIVF
jgi:hypothetical protein